MRRKGPEPIGDILVSYEATSMPTETLERLTEERFEQIELARKSSELRQNAQVLGWLLRIALHKIRALEAR
jgi:hypothetical protein